jgi:hypothetical protein
MQIEAIINEPVTKLGLGEEFDNGCRQMGFNTLKDILILTPDQLITTDGFNYNWLGQLVRFLSENKLLYYLQPLPWQEKVDVSQL